MGYYDSYYRCLALCTCAVLTALVAFYRSSIKLKMFALTNSSKEIFGHNSRLRQLSEFHNNNMRSLKIARGVNDMTNKHPSWCPNATCYNSHVCKPCAQRFLIEFATGRSGSTSIMHMLNMLPGVRMSGENNDALGAIHGMIDSIMSNSNMILKKTEGAWSHENISPGDFACPAQRMIEALNPPSHNIQELGSKYDDDDSATIIGFKTIRFLDQWEEEDEEAVQFLNEKFPCSRVVININSNITKQCASRARHLVNKDPDKCEEFLTILNGRMRNISALLGPHQAYFMDSVEWTGPNGTAKINEMVQWLGFDDCTFSKLIHDHKNSYLQDHSHVDLGPDCRRHPM